jgi:proteasome assembly chaperone (PAC2) family protein
MIAAFDGWNNGGEAATRAVRFLEDTWRAVPFAEIDPDPFYDFTQLRPTLRQIGEDRRTIDWPRNRFSSAQPASGPDVILFRGIEPHLNWKRYCANVIDLARSTGTRLVLTLGSLLSDVPHTRLPAVYGTAYEASVIEALGLEASSYEGPTGIVGVLHDRFNHAGLRSASFWSATPAYLGSIPAPRAQRALLQRVAELLRVDIPSDDLLAAEHLHDQDVAAALQDDIETKAHIAELEQAHDRRGESHDVDALINEVERFLREQ